MGNYNAHAPYILGEEWVPIRDEELVFSPLVNSVERGVAFTTTASRQVRDARFYVSKSPSPTTFYQVGAFNLYPYGTEDQTGPIRQVIMPVSSVGATGSNITIVGTDYPTALYQPGDNKYVQLAYNSGTTQRLSFFFPVSSYPELANKRILNVSMLYSGCVYDTDTNGNPISFINPSAATQTMTLLLQMDNAGNGQSFTPRSFASNTGVLDQLNTVVSPITGDAFFGMEVAAVDLGDINNCWDATNPAGTNEKLPWRYADLLRFEVGAASNRQQLRMSAVIPLTTGGASGVGTAVKMILDYVALRVIYCEEKRVAYGGQQFQYAYGMNRITARDLNQATDPVIAAGQYLPTLSFVSMGQVGLGGANSGEFPDLNATRQLYETPPHPAVDIAIPFPLEERLGETFTSTVSMILPQLTLHASGGTLTEPHVYGRQIAAQVYGANTATQEIYDDISGVDYLYPQVRFYARRFGDTTISLTLTGAGSLSGSTVAITPTDFDELAEIIDGWREVTLRFATPPTMGTKVSTEPSWVWSAAGETAGNRWEILGACAPAISGVPGSLYTLVPTANQLYEGTYQPPGGSVAELTWMPQGVGSPWVTGASADDSTDAVLIFSQDPPTVTGVAISQLTQTVTGIGLSCGTLPCCIPSGIAYQRLTWSATTLPSTGFGAYEIQRWDTTPGATFETIMLATSVAVTGFNDYEARVGLNSVYRVRTLNVLNFAGQWSTQVTGSPPTPGVTGGCSDQTGALIFTSNDDQSGASNAAYVMQWDGMPEESFGLPEADMVTFQPIYNRDGTTAFHGTERGLERFDRTVLLQAAAIDPIRLADAKTLRDLAWAALPYVCVRDERGDRWFANVRVPGISARADATKYMASIEVVELTQTPYPVDP